MDKTIEELEIEYNRCSFCLKPKSAVAFLFVSPDHAYAPVLRARICNECVAVYNRILEEKVSKQ